MPLYLKSSKLKSLYASLRAYLLARNIIKIYKRLNPNSLNTFIKIFEIGPVRADLARALMNKLNTNYYICDIDKSKINLFKKRIFENYRFNDSFYKEVPNNDLANNYKLYNSFNIAISLHVIEH